MVKAGCWHNDRIKEECGVVGIFLPGEQAARLAFFALFALQHRGQESAGIAVADGSVVRMHKEMGLVSKVFTEDILASLPGSIAIGHTRYSTTGASIQRNAQPVFCTSTVGEIAVAHNGNLVNSAELRSQIEAGGEHMDTTADSEAIARILLSNLHHGPKEAVQRTMQALQGAYSVTVLTPRYLIAFRDPSGVRPLSIGKLGEGYIVASESCAFEPIGATFLRDVEPGETVYIDETGLHSHPAQDPKPERMCLFEFIYFARPDSHMHGTSLYIARENMGRNLAIEHPVEADLVVPVPDSGIPAAIGFSRQSGIPFGEGMMKSRYIHRTFIQPDQRMRELGVRMKLSPITENIRGKRIVLVDDSIVRGTTTNQIVKMMFEGGATEVHVRITAPPIKYPCFYGIDMANRSELIAAQQTVEQIRDHLKATSLGYLSVEGAQNAVGPAPHKHCHACFTGDYPIAVPQGVTKDAFEARHPVGELATVSGGQFLLEVD